METKLENLKELLNASLKNAMSYEAYKTLVTTYAKEGKTTGENQSEALVNYTKLSDARMRRLDKTTKIKPEIEEAFTAYDRKITWLVLTESWCGDAAQTMPVMNKLAQISDTIDFKVILRDEHVALMQHFLTNGGMSIPKLVMIDSETHEVLGDWGPRPSVATQLVNDYKETNGALTPEFKKDLQNWYNLDKGQNTARDLAKMIG